MINIADELNAATEQGILGRAAQIFDPSQNKTQAAINSEVQEQLAQAGNTDEIKKIVNSSRDDVLGMTVINCGENIPSAIWGGVYQDIDEDGEFLGEVADMVVPDGFGVGSIVKAEDMQDSQVELFYVAKTASSPTIAFDGQNYSVEGVTEWLTVEKGKIYECIGRASISYTPQEEGETIMGYLYLYAEAKVSLKDIKDATNNIGTSSDQASESGTSLFAVLKAVWNKVVSIYNAITDSTNGLVAIKTAAASAATATDVSTAQGNILGSDGTNADNTTLKMLLNTINTNMYKGVPINTISGTSATIAPNTWNIWANEQTAAFTITKGSDVSGVLNEWVMRFSLGSSWAANTQITFSGWNNLQWNGGSVPTWAASKTYEINIVDNIAMWAEV